jgi:hypothetical protein
LRSPAVLVICIAAFAAGALAAESAARTPTTLVTSKGRIHAFAQDGGRIAWAAGRCATVRIKTLRTGRKQAVGSLAFHNAFLSDPCSVARLVSPSIELALAGTRALWEFIIDVRCVEFTAQVRTGALRERQRILERLEFGCGGGWFENAGDGSTLVYFNTSVDYIYDEACEERGECRFRVDAGSVARVSSGLRVRVPRIPPLAALAVSGDRIAVVPADRRAFDTPSVEAALNGPVQIRDPKNGLLLRSFAPAGAVKAVALSGRRLGVLVADTADAKRIERYDIGAGVLLGSTLVSPEVEAELAIAGRRILYRVGRAIYVMDVDTGVSSLIATANADPIGLSIEGRRVAWAENAASQAGIRGRIRAVRLPTVAIARR